jgi:glycosyltransferase involved in cell wall biosynthesis
MKLLFVSNLFPPHVVGGYEMGCQMHARAAARAGHDVLVATSMSFGSLVKQSASPGVAVRPIFEPVFDYEFGDRNYQRPLTYAGPGGIHPGNCLALAELIHTWRPDAIWMHNPLGLGPVGILETAASSGVPTVVHLMDFLDEGIRLSQHGFELAGRWAAAKARVHAIACSTRTLEENSRLGRYASAIVVPGGIEIDAIPCRDDSPRPDFPSHGPVRMVSFGQLKSHKGVQHVVAALGILRRWMRLDVELHLIGSCEAEFERELMAIATSLGCASAIHAHGRKGRDELHRLLATMHLAVLPLNEREAFGYVAPEAALHGMCVAIGGNAGCTEVFPENYPYLLAARDDPAVIAATVRRIIVNGDERRHWERALPAIVAERCDLDGVVMPRCLDFIAGIAARARTPTIAPEVALERTLATWQMNRNLSRLLGDDGPAPEDKQRRLGRRLNRALRRAVPAGLQYRFKTLAMRLRRLRAA